MPNRRYNSQIKKPGFLSGGQAKLDANKDGKISGKDFALLKKIADRNNLLELSMGMSADFKIAIKCGSTFIRVGTAIFGEREKQIL